jgi:hypothetical protein
LLLDSSWYLRFWPSDKKVVCGKDDGRSKSIDNNDDDTRIEVSEDVPRSPAKCQYDGEYKQLTIYARLIKMFFS